MDKKIYYDIVIRQIPRLLGQLDRNKNSETYGCFDRNYWHYKIADFSCARYQEAVLTLALLYKLKQKDNPYFKNKNILRWIEATLEFWCNIQNKDGSFNEWYPNEKSFVATAFSCYAISECLILLKKEIKGERIINSLRKAGDWLLKRSEWDATNQMSGAISSLYNIYVLTNNRKYLINHKNKLNQLLKKQNSEGWWNEYNGADISYLSLTVDYLSKLYKKNPNAKLKGSINKAIDFLSFFVHPNLTFGGEYGSRNTEYMIPHGMELNTQNKNAASISCAIRNSLKNSATITPYSVDDRYLCYIGYVWLQAYLDSKKTLKLPKYRFNQNFNKDFTNAKISVISNDNFYRIINYSKGGAFNLYLKKQNKTIHDSGILVKDKNNSYLTSSWISNSLVQKNNPTKIKGKLWKLKNTPMTSLKSTTLRVFSKTLGNSQKLSLAMKKILRKKLITVSEKSNISFSRQFTINNKIIKIVDSVDSKNRIKDIFLGEKYSNIFIPSSRYFQLQELNNKPLEFKNIRKNKFKVERSLTWDNKTSFKILD
jgi:hypothetical protein